MYLYPPEEGWLPILVASYDMHGLLFITSLNKEILWSNSMFRSCITSCGLNYIELCFELRPVCIESLVTLQIHGLSVSFSPFRNEKICKRREQVLFMDVYYCFPYSVQWMYKVFRSYID
jgi:hypothetical protein